MKEKYILTALDSFKCLADKCPWDCCSRFAVPVDTGTYQKWQSLPDTDENKAWLLAGVYEGEIHKKKQPILCNKENSMDCTFLQPNRLCAIHGKLGPEFLTKICRDYPRKKESPPNREISWALLSCPEMVRLVIFETTGPVFRHEPATGKEAARREKSANEQVSMLLYRLLGRLLASPEYPLNIRLTYLARVLGEITSLSEKQQLTGKILASFEEKHAANLRATAAMVFSGKLVTNPVNGLNLWNLLREGVIRFKLFEASSISEEVPIIQLARKANADEEARKLFYQGLMTLRRQSRPFLHKFDKAMERYLESSLMANGFPLVQNINPVIPFQAAAYRFAITQMLLWIKISATPEFTKNDITTIISRVEEKIHHNDELVKMLDKNPAFHKIGGYFDRFLEVC